jgi:hypothetical protein
MWSFKPRDQRNPFSDGANFANKRRFTDDANMVRDFLTLLVRENRDVSKKLGRRRREATAAK